MILFEGILLQKYKKEFSFSSNRMVSLKTMLSEKRRIASTLREWMPSVYSTWKPGSALRKGDWKLVVHYEDNRTELFNLAEDPGETTDISAKNPEQVSALRAILDKKLADSNARFPTPNPDYAPRD